MTAYVIILREGPVRDPAEMKEYQRKAAAGGDVKMTPLALYGALQALEGAAPDGVVLLQFPTVEDANAWYNSSGYQAAVPHRQKAANYRFFIVEGL